MADLDHLKIVRQGKEAISEWRQRYPDAQMNLEGADLEGTDLSGSASFSGSDLYEVHPRISHFMGANVGGADLIRANLGGANLKGAYLYEANLGDANLSGADLSGAKLGRAYLYGANLSSANLSNTNLERATLDYANLKKANLSHAALTLATLRHADLSEAVLFYATLLLANADVANMEKALLYGANLNGISLKSSNLKGAWLPECYIEGAQLTNTNLEEANISGCHVHGASVWNVKLDGAKQDNLIITPSNEPKIVVDNLEMAQFLYLLINNEKLRGIIETITSKVVLILGRFTPKRKEVLDKLREALRARGYLPILFDFEGPYSRDLTETVSLLAHMARFIIADLTDPKSIPQELQRTVESLPSVPVQPLLASSDREYGMFEHFKWYPWVLPIHVYDDQKDLLAALEEKVIDPAEAKAAEFALLIPSPHSPAV
jgi:uncharacterized protein YjbI with pentapeptide repeats